MPKTLTILLLSLALPASAHAFCGFYVAAEDGPLYSDATQVVLMREGTTTILSMQNAYRGPVEDFALVVPVPIVLREERVKTLPREVFERVDQLSSPRLVEYWEQDPCTAGGTIGLGNLGTIGYGSGAGSGSGYGRGAGGLRVTVEAEFAVGEYDIVILGAEDSSDLETWLRQSGYHIPDGAAAVLRPYVDRGMKFFVAKVDAERVTFEDGRAVLSPLRFHYDEERFQLPIRLGMLSSPGTQDLIVHILARNRRYEVANRPNVTIPTNLRVADGTREAFGPFYDSLFSAVRAQHPEAVVTEYAWQAQGCDPCPGPVLDASDLMTLGADVEAPRSGPTPVMIQPASTETRGALANDVVRHVLRRRYPQVRQCVNGPLEGVAPGSVLRLKIVVGTDGRVSGADAIAPPNATAGRCLENAVRRFRFPVADGATEVTASYPVREMSWGPSDALQSFVLTRLHYRYDRELDSDLVFREAEAIEGGREYPDAERTTPEPASANNFQARYVIRHEWEGPITCDEPRRGIWGPRPGEAAKPAPAVPPRSFGAPVAGGAPSLASLLLTELPGLTLAAARAGAQPGAPAESATEPPSAGEATASRTESPARSATGGCGSCATTSARADGLVFLALFGLVWGTRRRRRGPPRSPT